MPKSPQFARLGISEDN